MKFESIKEPIASIPTYARRQLKYILYSLGIIIFSLIIGTFGFDYFTELNMIDGFYNSSMILSGMGETVHMQTTQSKIFSSLYAFYSSIAFSSIIVVTFSPLVHRFLHFLNIDENAK